jgi:hypothetical protein
MNLVRFDAISREKEDPWNYAASWYERRKRDVTLACLPRQRFVFGFEPACAIGVLTFAFASRCDRLLGCDVSSIAVSRARERTKHSSNVQIDVREIPGQWLESLFDLVVMSEFLGSVGDEAIEQTAATTKRQPDGAIVLCNWRHPMQTGDTPADHVQRVFGDALQLPRVVPHEEADFLIEVWTPSGESVAMWIRWTPCGDELGSRVEDGPLALGGLDRHGRGGCRRPRDVPDWLNCTSRLYATGRLKTVGLDQQSD